MTIGVLLNAQKAVNMEDVQRMASICKDGGARLLSDAQNASFWGMQRVARDELYQSCEIIIVFGGDGTLLAAARGAARHGNAVLGINLGRLGFLTEAEANDLCDVAAAVISGDYTTEKRMMLSGVMPDGKKVTALNDIAVSRHYSLNLIYCDVSIDGRWFDRYRADGVLVASPTGSTAYSLACGGPVINPALDCLVLSSICPHSLRARPLVLSPDESIAICAGAPSKGARVDADGVFEGVLEPGQQVTVTRSDLCARFIRLKERSFYSVLRNKLMEQQT